MDVPVDHRVLPNWKHASLTIKRVYLPAGQANLPGVVLVWANEPVLGSQAPVLIE
jgi:hypothetical protein